MKLYILFGLPGAGKTYVGSIFQKQFGFYFYEGDTELIDEMKEAIQTKTVFTDEMRDKFFAELLKKINLLSKSYQRIVVSQTFIKEKYRQQVLATFPEAQFILVQTDTAIREKRLEQRTDYPLDLAYSRKMVANFEDAKIPHTILVNNEQGELFIQKKLRKLLPY